MNKFTTNNIRNLKKLILSFLFIFSASLIWGQTLVFLEEFNDSSKFTTSIDGFYSDGANGYFGIYDATANTDDFGAGTKPTGITTSGFSNNYLVGEDLDRNGTDATQTLTWTGIDITNIYNMSISADIASSGNKVYDGPDNIFIEVSIDGGAYVKVLAVEADGTQNNEDLAADDDLDGTGDGTKVTNTSHNFSLDFAGSGNSLDMKLTISVNSVDEEIAVDNLMIEGVYDNDSDSDIDGPDVASQPTTSISSLIDTAGEAFEVFKFDVWDWGSSDGLATVLTQVTIHAGANDNQNWVNVIEGAKLSIDGGTSFVTTGVPTITDDTIVFPITSGNLDITDGTQVTVSLFVWLKDSGLIDNGVLEFEIPSSSHECVADHSGSLFDSSLSGAISKQIAIDVSVTELQFIQQTSTVVVNTIMSPIVKIAYTDENGNIELDYDGADVATLSQSGSTFAASTETSLDLANGILTLNYLEFTLVAGGVTITITDGYGIDNDTIVSNYFNVYAEDTIWLEDFESYTVDTGIKGPGTTTSGDYASVTKWSLDVANANFTNEFDYFMTLSNDSSKKLCVQDSEGIIYWNSESIDISSYYSIELGIDINEDSEDDLENEDFYRALYRIDGGTWRTFSTNGYKENDFTSTHASQTGLSGSTLEIQIKTRTNVNGEHIYFDNIKVQGLAKTSCGQLFISEYGNDANGNYLEIVNPTDTSIDLSNFQVWRALNGGEWYGAGTTKIIPLTGTLNRGDVLVVAKNIGEVSVGDLFDSDMDYNGNDNIGLAWNGGSGTNFSLIDAVGNEYGDPGNGWEVAGINDATQDHTLVRKETVDFPNSNWDDSRGTNATNSEWIVETYTQEHLTNHASNCIDIVDWCNYQSPSTGILMLGQPIYDVYTRVHEAGITNQVTESADIETWIGVSTIDATSLASFETSDWTWIPATFNNGFDTSSPNDEYQANIIPAITSTGTHYIVSRYRYLGNPYQYGGYNSDNGAGGWGGFWGETSNGAQHVSGQVNVKTISIIGDAANGWGDGQDIDMTSIDGVNYTLTQALTADGLKFRDQHNFDAGTTNWGDNENDFPIGIAEVGGSNIAVTPAATYFITFNITTGAYSFINSLCNLATVTWDGANWSGTPDITKKAIISGNYDMTTLASFSSCGCQIDSDITLKISSNKFLDVIFNIVNNGTIEVENGGSFVQHSDVVANSGTGKYKVWKETTPYTEYDYTYWSSPVVGETVEDAFNANTTVNAVADSNGDAFSPPTYILTLNTANFFDGNSDGFDDNGDDWNTGVTGIMTPGIGYAAMGAGSDFPFNDSFASGLEQTLFFESTEVNNGDITVSVVTDAGADAFENQNFIGNPYPSAIDLKLFINDSDNTELTGTFYIWSHDSLIGSGTNTGPDAYNFSNLDYATFNANTGVGAAANKTDFSASGAVPTNYLASCQGFLADVKNAGDIKFKNSMRVTGNNNNFFDPNVVEKDVLWLKFTSDAGHFRQTAIAFIDEASDSYDMYDSKRMESGTDTDFYSLATDSNQILAIQGLSSFNEDKTVNLGIEITEIGIYHIAIDNVGGVFNTNQVIYLEDTYTNAMHNLKDGKYTFGSNVGEAINDRFVLHFKAEGLATQEEIVEELLVYPNPSNGVFTIGVHTEDAISIEVYDITGKLLINNLNTLSRTIDLTGYNQGFYFAKISQNGQSITKKLIIK